MKVLGRVRNEILAIRGKDPAMSVVDVGILERLAWGRVELDALLSDGLPGGKGVGASLNRVGGCDKLGQLISKRLQRSGSSLLAGGDTYIAVRLGDVSIGVRILQRLLSGVQRPRGNVHLLTKRGRVALHERVHVLPAVEVSDPADLSLDNRLSSIAGAVSKHETLDVRGADLAAVVEDIPSR